MLVVELVETPSGAAWPGWDNPYVSEQAEADPSTGLFRDVLGRFCSGVTVVTAVVDGHPVGLTCQAFSSVSLDPPLVLFCPAKGSRAWPRIQASGSFCVNLLAAGQVEVSEAMASRRDDRFAGVAWVPSEYSGSPRITGVLGYVDCTIEAMYDAGDHEVVIGRVQYLEAYNEPAADPLLFFGGRYRRLDDGGPAKP